MTKAELIESIYKKAGKQNELTKKATTEVVEAVFAEIGTYFKKRGGVGKKFTYPGFGTFTKKKRNARKGRNPQTGAAIKIPASFSVSFSPGTVFKKDMNPNRK